MDDSKFDNFFSSEPDLEHKKKELEQKQEEEIKSLETLFANQRQEWTNKVKEMGAKLKRVVEINELQVQIYSERQMAVDQYHYLLDVLVKLNKRYRSEYAKKYKHYSFEANLRFPNETSKVNQVLSDISDLVVKRERFNNHIKFFENTIKTIDNIIFGIRYRIDVEQIARGK